MSPEAIRAALADEIAPWLRAICPVDPVEVNALVDALVEFGEIKGGLTRRDILAARLVAAAVFDYQRVEEEPAPPYGRPGVTPLDFARSAYFEADSLLAG